MKKGLLIIALFAGFSTMAQNQMQNESANMLSGASNKISQLAEAASADIYSYSPEDGVRSFAGVLQHVISANYFFAMKLGASLPDGVNMETIEQDYKTKEQLVPAVKQSVETIIAAIKGIEDGALGDKLEFPFPGEYTNMSAILIALSHGNEHLGQLIAYGRANGLAPPWSK